MLTAVKQSVHRMTSHLQLINSHLEMMDYTKALLRTKQTIKEMHALEANLTGLANAGMTVPENGAVVVGASPIHNWNCSSASNRSNGALPAAFLRALSFSEPPVRGRTSPLPQGAVAAVLAVLPFRYRQNLFVGNTGGNRIL
jgi:hypothetical protein